MRLQHSRLSSSSSSSSSSSGEVHKVGALQHLRLPLRRRLAHLLGSEKEACGRLPFRDYLEIQMSFKFDYLRLPTNRQYNICWYDVSAFKVQDVDPEETNLYLSVWQQAACLPIKDYRGGENDTATITVVVTRSLLHALEGAEENK